MYGICGMPIWGVAGICMPGICIAGFCMGGVGAAGGCGAPGTEGTEINLVYSLGP